MEWREEQTNRIVERVVTRLRSAPGRAEALRPIPSGTPVTGRVAWLTAPETLELRHFPLRPIRPEEILIKVEACGICGTDLHCFASDPFGLAPVVLGHEGTGTVIEVGSAIRMDGVGKPVCVGDRVVTSIFETSESCLIAKYNPRKANLCDDLRVYGLLPHDPDNPFNGYFSEYLIIQPGSSFFVVNDMSVDLRVLIEPAAVVCHALERGKECGVNLNFRSRVIVQGCGAIGLMMVAVLKTYGINNIIAIDGNTDRLAHAAAMGADVTLNYRDFSGIEDLASRIASLTKGFGAHFGFQTTGSPEAFAGLFHCIRRGGGIVEIGHFVDGGSCSVNPHRDICRKEITVTGSWVYNSFEYPYAYHFLQRAEKIGIPVARLITHRFPLSRIQEAFEAAQGQKGVKVVVQAAG